MSITIGIGRTLISGGTGSTWATYWATLISATVEQAAPTNVVLTFPTPSSSLGASDFTISGFTISSASWTGAVLTLVLSLPVNYGNILTVTFVKSGGSHAVTNNVTHPLVINTNTAGWYLADDLTTITKDGSNAVSSWRDKLGSGHNLVQGTALRQPLWVSPGSIRFDGLNHALQTANFGYSQPEVIYMVVKHITWAGDKHFLDGNVNDSMLLYDYGAFTPNIAAYAGTVSTVNSNLAVNTYGIIRLTFNGASSRLIVNNTAPITGNFGAANGNKITLASPGNVLGGNKGNVEFKEALFKTVVPSSADDILIYNYLAARHGFAKI